MMNTRQLSKNVFGETFGNMECGKMCLKLTLNVSVFVFAQSKLRNDFLSTVIFVCPKRSLDHDRLHAAIPS